MAASALLQYSSWNILAGRRGGGRRGGVAGRRGGGADSLEMNGFVLRCVVAVGTGRWRAGAALRSGRAVAIGAGRWRARARAQPPLIPNSTHFLISTMILMMKLNVIKLE